ncbi:MAG TPA: hypothetical protein VMD31_08935 [Opitutaceae bacterium]|nr:hypothetical protein [Opitutaceae bacterium]
MTPHLQTVLALIVVALAVLGLMWRVMARRSAGCGPEGCGAISRDARALRKKLRKS